MQDASNQPTRVPAEGQALARLLTGEHLDKALEPMGFIKDGSPTCVEGAKYDFRMSPIILKASFGTPINLEKLPEHERAQVKVEPGEVVFVRTIEKLALPNNVMAMLSPKRKLSHQGIIALGGFAIDPKYCGPLFIGLYNFSSTPFNLQPGRKLIAAMFYELMDPEIIEFPVPEPMGEQEDFPDELVTLIKNYKPVELKWVSEALAETQRRLDVLSSELHDDRSWKQEFKDALSDQTKQIDKLLEGLKEEREARQAEDTRIQDRLYHVSHMFAGFRVVWVIIAIIVAAIAGGLADHFVPKWFGH
jgi:deoxycytidine triphosphate deaminase